MGKFSSIQWCFSSLNLQMGCDGCELWIPSGPKKKKICYAGKQIDGDGNRPGFKGRKGYPVQFDMPKLFLERMDEGEKWKEPSDKERDAKPWISRDYPRVIFTNDMGDTFSKKLPKDWLAPMLPRMAATPHQWLILTKRPTALLDFSTRHVLPANVWPGTTVTSMQTANRVKPLAQVAGGGAKFISFEPLWGPLDFDKIEGIEKVTWAIFGGESGNDPGRTELNLRWLEDAIDACRARGIRVFVKQLGVEPYYPLGRTGLFRGAEEVTFHSKAKGPQFRLDVEAGRNVQLLGDSHGGDWEEWPEHLRIREMPIWIADGTTGKFIPDLL